MSGRPVKKGTTNVSSIVRIIDSSDGSPETGVVAATGGLAFNYRREGEATVAITGLNNLALLTTAHTDGGILHIGDGYYRIDFQDAAFAVGAGEDGVLLTGTATNMIVIGTYHPLVDYDPYDTIRMGLTALPAAAADAAGGLPISDAGGLDLDDIPITSEFEARTIAAASYFDPAADTVALVTTVTNQITAATMSDAIWDEALAGHVGADSAGLVLNEWQDGGRLDLILDDVPTTAEFDARTLIAASYFDPAADTVALVTNLTNLPTIPANWLTAAGIANDAITEPKVANDAISARQLATDAVNEIRDAILSDSTSFAGADIAVIRTSTNPSVSGTADSGSTTTLIDSTGLSQADDDYWNGCWVRFTSGNIVGQTRLITEFSEFINRITFSPALTQAVTTQTYEIWPAAATGVDWGSVQRPTTAVDLSATDIQLADTVTTVTNQLTAATIGNQVWDTDATGRQTLGTFGQAIGDSGANAETIYDAVVTDATGTNVAIDVIAVNADTGTTIPNHLTDIKGTSFIADTHSLINIEGYVDVLDDGTSGNVKIATDVAAVLVDTTDMQPKIGAPLTDVSADIAAVKAETALVVADTGELQTDWVDGGRLDLLLDAIKVITDALGATAAANLARTLGTGGVIPFTVDTVVNAHTPTITEFQADDVTEGTADHYNGRVVIWLTGNLTGQATDITDYAAVGGIGQFTVTALTEPPANNDTGIIL